MKRVLFTFLFFACFISMRADPVTITADAASVSPTASNFVLFQPLTYTVQTPLIDGWWHGGYGRMVSMGVVFCALPDSTSVLDLYEFGFPSGIFLRKEKNNLSFPGEYGKLFQYWLSPQDFVSAVVYPQINFSGSDEHNDAFYFNIEYARKLSDSVSIGTNLTGQYRYLERDGQTPDFLNKYGERRFNWLISIDWESSGFSAMGHELGVRNAFSIGTLQREVPQYWYDSKNYAGDIFSFKSSDNYYYERVSPSSEVLISNSSASNSGAGLAYAFMLSDPAKESFMVIRLNTKYDWQAVWHYYTYSSLTGVASDGYSGQEAVINACLAARLMFGGFMSVACIKNLICRVAWGRRSSEPETQVQLDINQPLVLEIAYINDFIKIPVSYADFIGAPLIKIGLEWTVIKWLDLRAGCGFNRPGQSLIGAIGFGAGINLDNFILNCSYYNGLTSYELKWFF